MQSHALVWRMTQCDNFHRCGGGGGWRQGHRRKRQSGRSERGRDARLEEGSVNLQTKTQNIEQHSQTLCDTRKRARTVDTTTSMRTYHISLAHVRAHAYPARQVMQQTRQFGCAVQQDARGAELEQETRSGRAVAENVLRGCVFGFAWGRGGGARRRKYEFTGFKKQMI